jgi:ribosome-binding factor A
MFWYSHTFYPRCFAVESRSQKYHRERVSEALREEIQTIVEGELGDPRIGLVNVSEVRLADDGRSAHILVTTEGNEEEGERALVGLQAAIGFIRHELVERLHLRKPPELVFRLDRSRKYEARVDELLKRTRAKAKKRTG